jgi:hypothetical protein
MASLLTVGGFAQNSHQQVNLNNTISFVKYFDGKSGAYNSYEDLINNKPSLNMFITDYSSKVIKLKANKTDKKITQSVKLKKTPYRYFGYECQYVAPQYKKEVEKKYKTQLGYTPPEEYYIHSTQLVRVDNNECYLVLEDGAITLFYVDDCALLSTDGTTYNAIYHDGCNWLKRITKNTYYSEGLDGEIKPLTDEVFESFLKKYNLLAAYKADTAFDRKDTGGLYLLHKRIKYAQLINKAAAEKGK